MLVLGNATRASGIVRLVSMCIPVMQSYISREACVRLRHKQCVPTLYVWGLMQKRWSDLKGNSLLFSLLPVTSTKLNANSRDMRVIHSSVGHFGHWCVVFVIRILICDVDMIWENFKCLPQWIYLSEYTFCRCKAKFLLRLMILTCLGGSDERAY